MTSIIREVKRQESSQVIFGSFLVTVLKKVDEAQGLIKNYIRIVTKPLVSGLCSKRLSKWILPF